MSRFFALFSLFDYILSIAVRIKTPPQERDLPAAVFFVFCAKPGRLRAAQRCFGSMMSVQPDTSHWPCRFSPTATTVPSDFRPTVT